MATDIVLINDLHLTTTIGPDHWGKRRTQPLSISVFLHLVPSYLTTAGRSDDVLDSVHYGHLAKAIAALVDAANAVAPPSPAGFNSIDALIDAVTQEAFTLAGDAALAARVVVSLSKYILLATGGLSVDVTTSRTPLSEVSVSLRGERSLLKHPEHSLPEERQKAEELLPQQQQQQVQLKQQLHRGARKVSVQDLVLPVLIGVNPPEREAKQLVRTHLTFYEHPSHLQRADDSLPVPVPLPDYPGMIDKIAQSLASSTYLTLEKFVFETVRMACLAAGPHLDAVTVRAEKPSALSFAEASGVEMTRRRRDFLVGGSLARSDDDQCESDL